VLEVSAQAQPLAARSKAPPGTLVVGVAAFGAYHLALALFMAVAPRAFFTNVGPFGTVNTHYIRDTATFNAAIGVALLVAVRRPSWRVPVLALTTLQFVLHSVNHLVDIGRAHPAWTGYFDFFSLAAATLVLAWLLRIAINEEPAHPSTPDPTEGAPR
jgi:hypothetical protein